jgi:hypothetical protein
MGACVQGFGLLAYVQAADKIDEFDKIALAVFRVGSV